MREVIAYNKNLITGDVAELNKEKDATNIIGKATIEIFDYETGEKIYEAETENVINESISKLLFFESFFRRLMVGGNTGNGFINIPFNTLILTDYNGAESSAEKYVKGTLIGWADKDTAYAGVDAQRGTINLTESEYTFNMQEQKITLKFVFDFPTNAANGTFQSIYWSRNPSLKSTYGVCIFNNISTIPAKYTSVCSINLSTSSCSDYESIGYNLIEISASPKVYYGFRTFTLEDGINIDSGTINFLKGDGTQLSSNDGSFNNILAYNPFVYVASVQSSSIILNKHNKDGTFVSTTTINASQFKDAGARNPVFTAIRLINNVFYISCYYNVNSKNICHIIKLTNTFTIDTDYTLTQKDYANNDWSVTLIGKTSDYWVLNDINGAMLLDNSFNRIFYGMRYSDWNSGTSFRVYFKNNRSCIYLAFYYNFNSNMYSYGVCGPQAIGAQTLLAAPITKTPTNTMKIQYSFVIDNVMNTIF